MSVVHIEYPETMVRLLFLPLLQEVIETKPRAGRAKAASEREGA